MNLYEELEKINKRPKPFEYYTTTQFWNDPHISKGMLEAHLNPDHDAASYRHETIDRSVEWMAARFDVSTNTRICDFGCGPGLWARRFAEKGADVTGIDVSERSLSYARNAAMEKNLSIRYFNQNYLEFSTEEKFDLVTMISRDFSVLSPEQRRALLQTFRSVLADGAMLILDVDSESYFHSLEESVTYKFYKGSGFWSVGPHHVFSNRFKYTDVLVVCDRHTVVERGRVLDIYNWNQCYSLKAVKALFEENGLQIVECYADTAGSPLNEEAHAITIVAEKSASTT